MTDATIDYDALDFFRGSETVADPYPYFDWLRASVRSTGSPNTACTWSPDGKRLLPCTPTPTRSRHATR